MHSSSLNSFAIYGSNFFCCIWYFDFNIYFKRFVCTGVVRHNFDRCEIKTKYSHKYIFSEMYTYLTIFSLNVEAIVCVRDRRITKYINDSNKTYHSYHLPQNLPQFITIYCAHIFGFFLARTLCYIDQLIVLQSCGDLKYKTTKTIINSLNNEMKTYIYIRK